MATVYRRAAARRDLIAHFVYLAQNAGEAVAGRFLSNAESSFNDLAAQPMMGGSLTLQHKELTDIRKWRIKAFENYLIFYQPRPDGVSIVRVLYATQDWWRLLSVAD